jgi:hypothetical protein
MPTPDQILAGLHEISNQWKVLAIVWHVFYGVVSVQSLGQERLSARFAGFVLTLPFISVSCLAWVNGNPFNGTFFALLSLILVCISVNLRTEKLSLASKGMFTTGAVLFLFGWSYPHFLDASSFWAYLYLSPLGLIPCPTLSATIGLSFMLNNLSSRLWMFTLGIAALFYGIFGVFRLGVLIDLILLGAGIVAVIASFPRASIMMTRKVVQ